MSWGRPPYPRQPPWQREGPSRDCRLERRWSLGTGTTEGRWVDAPEETSSPLVSRISTVDGPDPRSLEDCLVKIYRNTRKGGSDTPFHHSTNEGVDKSWVLPSTISSTWESLIVRLARRDTSWTKTEVPFVRFVFLSRRQANEIRPLFPTPVESYPRRLNVYESYTTVVTESYY